jgi:hypothetical protein
MKKIYFSKLLNKVVTSKDILNFKAYKYLKNYRLMQIEERYINIQKDMSVKIDLLPLVQDVVRDVIDKTVLNKHRVLCYYK